MGHYEGEEQSNLLWLVEEVGQASVTPKIRSRGKGSGLGEKKEVGEGFLSAKATIV